MNDSGLLDACADLRNVVQIDTLNSEVVLVVLFLFDDHSLRAVNTLVHFETQEVLDFYGLNEKKCTLPLSMTLTTMGKWE